MYFQLTFWRSAFPWPSPLLGHAWSPTSQSHRTQIPFPSGHLQISTLISSISLLLPKTLLTFGNILQQQTCDLSTVFTNFSPCCFCQDATLPPLIMCHQTWLLPAPETPKFNWVSPVEFYPKKTRGMWTLWLSSHPWVWVSQSASKISSSLICHHSASCFQSFNLQTGQNQHFLVRLDSFSWIGLFSRFSHGEHRVTPSISTNRSPLGHWCCQSDWKTNPTWQKGNVPRADQCLYCIPSCTPGWLDDALKTCLAMLQISCRSTLWTEALFGKNYQHILTPPVDV